MDTDIINQFSKIELTTFERERYITKINNSYSHRDLEWLRLVKCLKKLDYSHNCIMDICGGSIELLEILELHHELLTSHYQDCYRCIEDIENQISIIKKC